MTPEEAQKRTEEKWAILTTEEDLAGTCGCGWCDFAKEVQRGRVGATCHHFCPVYRVFGESCNFIEEYAEWYEAVLHDTFEVQCEAARKVHALLIARREELIDAGKEILNESSGRKG